MNRFFVLSWRSTGNEEPEEVAAFEKRLRGANPAWTTALRQPGMLALHAGRKARSPTSMAIAGRGMIFGRVFRRSDAGPCLPLTALEGVAAKQILGTEGRALIEDYWGSYVAFLRGPGGEILAVRDPTGSVSCYFACEGNLTVFFSHAEDYLANTTRQHAVNWRHVGAYLHFSRLVSDETGIEGVQQVRAGERVRVRDGTIDRAFLWHPVSIYESGTIEDSGEALAMLRNAVSNSVQTWASCHERILLELSGGLDSAIVLACLAAAGRRSDVLCFNMYTETRDGDERDFARKAARRAGCDMVEIPFRPTAKRLQDMLRTVGVASPAMGMLRSEAEDARARHCREGNIDAVFSGQGGDNFFQRRKDVAIPGEYLRRHGVGRKLPRVLRDTANLTGKSIWSVVMASLASGLARRPLDPYAVCAAPSFWNHEADAATRPADIRHPWVVDAARLPACKTQQVFDIADAQVFYAPLCGYADIVHPLITQPVMECVLRIPCYLLTAGGQDRSLARAAFADSVPAEILARTDKGSATGYFQTLIMENAQLMRETLLDGALVRQRLLDSKRLEAALSYGSLMRGRELGSVLTAFLSESWIANLLAA